MREHYLMPALYKVERWILEPARKVGRLRQDTVGNYPRRSMIFGYAFSQIYLARY
jgi:hypothetical protein